MLVWQWITLAELEDLFWGVAGGKKLKRRDHGISEFEGILEMIKSKLCSPHSHKNTDFPSVPPMFNIHFSNGSRFLISTDIVNVAQQLEIGCGVAGLAKPLARCSPLGQFIKPLFLHLHMWIIVYSLKVEVGRKRKKSA